MILYKSNLISGITRMPSSNKHCIWVKLDSSFFGLNDIFDIFVSGVYLPPSNSNYYKDQDIDIMDKLRSDIIKYSSQDQIIITGDLNSRLGNLQEEFSFINDDPDAQNTIDNIESLPVREFMDPSTNQSGRKLMDLLNESSLISLNGRKLGDATSKLTCHQYNGSSTVDLNIV